MAKRKRRKSDSSGIFILFGIVFALLSVAIIAGYLVLRTQASSEAALNDENLCPVDGPNAITAILLDVTDPIADITGLDLRNEFQALISSISKGSLIQVYALTEKEGELELTFTGCNPGDGQSVSEWTNNPRIAQERWEKGFQRPLDEVSQRLQNGKSGEQSPIMAAIQRINTEAFGPPAYRSLPKTLVIASDMIEHTAAYSMYRGGPVYSKYETSPASAKFRTPLNNVSVRILEFQRPDMAFTDLDLANFWKEWIAGNSGQLASFKRLQGIR